MADITCRRESVITVNGCPDAHQEVHVVCTGPKVRSLLSVNITRPPDLWVADALTAAGFGNLLPEAPQCDAPCLTRPPVRFSSEVRGRNGILIIKMRAWYSCIKPMGDLPATGTQIEVQIEPPESCPPSGAEGAVVVTVTIIGGQSVTDKDQESTAKGFATGAARGQDKSDLCPFPDCAVRWDGGVPGRPSIDSEGVPVELDGRVVYQYTYKYKCLGHVTTRGQDRTKAFDRTHARPRGFLWAPVGGRQPLDINGMGSALVLARTVFGTGVALRIDVAKETSSDPLLELWPRHE